MTAKKILFVCTGNICRSPTAEAIARHKAKLLGLEKDFIFDSAGIEGFHIDETPDPRSVKVGKDHGVSFDGIVSRKIMQTDFSEFDLILAMDKSHYSRMMRIAPRESYNKIKLFLKFCEVKNSWNDDVIDPYHRASGAFDEVYNIIDLALENFLQKPENKPL